MSVCHQTKLTSSTSSTHAPFCMYDDVQTVLYSSNNKQTIHCTEPNKPRLKDYAACKHRLVNLHCCIKSKKTSEFLNYHYTARWKLWKMKTFRHCLVSFFLYFLILRFSSVQVVYLICKCNIYTGFYDCHYYTATHLLIKV